MELGTYRLAEINKGGGLRQKAVGEATQYLNGIGAWVDMPTSMTPKAHSHSIPELYCGVPDNDSGRILISGSGAFSNPTWMAAGTNGKILGWTSGAPAWVDAPSGSGGRARNIRFMTASGAIDHTSGTDTLIIASITTSAASMQLPTTATAGDRIELYSTSIRDASNWPAYFTCSSALIWPVAFVDPDDPVRVSSWGAGIYPPGYLFAIWDGTYWRVGYLNVYY